MTNKLTRRQWHKTVFEAGVACVAGTAGPAFMLSACTDNKQRVDAGLDPLIVHGGPATPSLPLIHLAESGLLAPVVQKTQFQMFRGHDEVRAGIVGNGWPVSMVPTQLAANLYNKKMPIRFMTVLTWGLTYFISRQPGITRIEHLAGSRIALSSKNDLNDQMFAYLTRRAGMVPDKDMHVSYMASPVEAVQWLHAGRVDHVLLAEPQCSAALAPQGQAPLYRSFAFGDLRRAVDGESRIPRAGIMLHQRVVEQYPDLVKALRQALAESVQWTLDNPQLAAQASKPYFSIPVHIVASAVAHSNLVAADALSHQAALNHYFELIGRFNPALIKGKAPDKEFYV